jgi:phage regulator Rha-like protein
MPNDFRDSLIKNQNGQAVTTSLLVAEKLGKRHADVIKAIWDAI